MTALLKYDAACRAVAAAKTLDEVRDWEDKAAAVREYTRRIGNRSLELDAIEIRERARRRRGELLLTLKADGKIARGSAQMSSAEDISTLEQLGVTRNESSRDQAIAALDGNSFERLIGRCRAYAEAHPEKHAFDMLTAEQREAKNAAKAAALAERTLQGGKVDDLHALIAGGHRFSAILADPPWHFIPYAESGEGRSASRHYTTDRKWRDIIELPVKELAADDCVLFMWMVDWCPRLALEVIEAWGFAHKTTAFTWAKQNASGEGWHMGQGYWTRANPEDCWLATRGQPKRINADVRQLIVAPVLEHSRKPDEAHLRIERLVSGPYLELYARRERENWVTWGNELKFKMPLPPHHPETGEIIETVATVAPDCRDAEPASVSSPSPDTDAGPSRSDDEQFNDIPEFLRIGHPACSWRSSLE
jgi:N6-adenosine-specific RNA methylase IME4